MPYAKWKEVNPAIKGIKPQVTLAMANHIGDMAEAMERDGTAKNPWAAAIATFKREYKVSGGRWVKRPPKAKEGASMGMSLLDIRLGEMYDAEIDSEMTVEEAKQKQISGRSHSAGDFLVVEDPNKPTTWHLPVRINGKASRRLAGAAWAALFNPKGYRGNRYTGPDAGKAKTALKALYKAEEWELPETAAEGTPNLKEGDWVPQDWKDYPSVPWNAKSFADVEMAMSAREATEQLHALTYQFGELARNVLNDSTPDLTSADKLAALKDLATEYLSRVEELMDEVEAGKPTMEYEAGEAAPVTIGETHTGAVLALQQAMISEGADGASVPMTMDVVLIEPGWGNSRDKNYYGREMLAKDAKVFEGAKMYETDHRPAEKSTRTWVSTVKAIKGANENGGPVAEVVVHDEDFAKRVRALDEAGMLGRMECSILAGGLARKGKVNGQEGHIVERITEAQSVDWVTRAGAGGRALKLSESEGQRMDRIVQFKVLGAAAETESEALAGKLGTHVVDLFGEGAKVEEVVLAEVGAETPPKPEGKPDPKPDPTSQTFMEAEAVKTAVEATNLPAPCKARLSAGKYADAPALEVAILAESEYVKALTGSGKPFGHGESTALDQDGSKAMTAEEKDKEAEKIFARYGLHTIPAGK